MTAVISEHIQITPGVCGGKPRIAGRRIRVQDIAVAYEQQGMTPAAIVEDYTPSISLADVHAALAYYYEHPEDIRQQNQADEEFVAKMAVATPSFLAPAKTERT